MRKRCLPSKLIVRNVVFLLVAWIGALLLAVETHDTANQQSQRSEELRRLFLYRVVTKLEQGS
ncbi:MAG: hypothetical protein ICV77_00265 [Cyanobacteria bacterium Co-bin8]|nr:hypothetical protein [Cyanobacteria bacterium Co-bin8]